MKQRRYSEKEKIEIVSEFLEERKTAGISLRWYSSITGIPYYTLRIGRALNRWRINHMLRRA